MLSGLLQKGNSFRNIQNEFFEVEDPSSLNDGLGMIIAPRHLFVLLLLCLALVLTAFRVSPVLAQVTFNAHTITTSANGAASVFAIDVDGDLDIDVLSASTNDNKIAWYENDGSEGFIRHTISTSASGANSVFAIDIDSDGDIDVLSSSENDGKIAWYENNGSQSFTEHIISVAAGVATAVFAIDVDGDTDIDVLSSSSWAGDVMWYENNGSEIFTPHSIATLTSAQDVFAIDVDGDNDIDVFSVDATLSGFSWFKNDGSENFSRHDENVFLMTAVSVFAVDIDADNDIDVLAVGLTDPRFWWWQNDGSGNFNDEFIGSPASRPTSVFAIDLDGDNDVDIIWSDEADDNISWFDNDGSQNFTEHEIGANVLDASDVFALDVDGDGDVDVLSASSLDNTISWYEQLAPLDFGDAPDTGAGIGTGNYETRLSDDGARHNATGAFLGVTRDDETDGQPTADADGDDVDANGADEDGVTFLTTSLWKASTNTQVGIEVVSSAVAKLDAWVDFNQNGDWTDAGEQIFNDEALSGGTDVLSFTVPSSVMVGTTYARFRISSAGVALPTGLAPDGEVEDYKLTVQATGSGVTISPGSGRGDPITIVRSGTDIKVSDSGGKLLFQGPMADGNDVTITGTTGTDTFILDLSAGDPFPGGTLTIDGLSGSGDKLKLTGGPVTTVTYMSLNNTDGSVTVDGLGISGTLHYINLAPIVDPVVKVFEVHTFAGGTETIVLEDDPAGGTDTSFIDSDAAESVTFFNPSASITVNAGTGDDTFTLTPLDAAITTPLIVFNGGTGDDDATIAPSKIYAIEANGDTHTGGDVLTIDLCSVVGVTATLTTGAPGSGTYAFTSGFKDITYTTFETVSTGLSQLTPVDTQSGVSIEPTFTWAAGVGDASYTLEISTADGSGFAAGVVFTKAGIVPLTYSIDFDTDSFKLDNATTYYWRISGDVTGSCAIQSLLSIAALTPELSYPKPDLTIASSTFNFSWNTGSPTGGLKFLLEVDGATFDISDGLDIGSTTTTSTMFASSGLASSMVGGGTYTWRVTIMTSDGRVVAISSPQSFSILGGAALPTLSYPTGGMTIYTTNPILSWYPGFGTTGLIYDLWYSEQGGTYIKVQTTDTFFQVSSLSTGVTYNWKVRSKVGSSGAWGAFSSTAVFNVAVGLPPAPFVGSGTGSTVFTLEPTLDWLLEGDAEDITSFSLQWSLDSTFASLDGAHAGLTQSEYTLMSSEQLELNETYHWRVRAILVDGSATSWTDERANAFFTTADAGQSLVPQLDAIPGGGIIEGPTVSLRWSVPGPSERVAFYEVTYSESESFEGATLERATHPALDLFTNRLTPGRLYYWKVRSSDGFVMSDYSATRTFVITPGSGPVVPIAGSPALGALVESGSPHYSWYLPAPSTGSLIYDLEIAANPDFSEAVAVTGLATSTHAGAPLPPGHYYWRVRSRTSAGQLSDYSATAEFETLSLATATDGAPELRERFSIEAVYPNPFSRMVTFEFSTTQATHMNVRIYNVLGQLVRTLVSENVAPGHHRKTWNARDDSGLLLPGGVYYYRFSAEGASQAGAFVFMR